MLALVTDFCQPFLVSDNLPYNETCPASSSISPVSFESGDTGSDFILAPTWSRRSSGIIFPLSTEFIIRFTEYIYVGFFFSFSRLQFWAANCCRVIVDRIANYRLFG